MYKIVFIEPMSFNTFGHLLKHLSVCCTTKTCIGTFQLNSIEWDRWSVFVSQLLQCPSPGDFCLLAVMGSSGFFIASELHWITSSFSRGKLVSLQWGCKDGCPFSLDLMLFSDHSIWGQLRKSHAVLALWWWPPKEGKKPPPLSEGVGKCYCLSVVLFEHCVRLSENVLNHFINFLNS